ncbi:homoserine dehydrogenase [Lactiplantibacillus herbarum]|uniref:homoserine dehydrogenase n=1 Tax=Lactiplantibacillus herbarum TaxID=1670446 RepID=UPI00064F9667|nr:homoserine dehydrogenase [Lactiplantibacillus herbarum]
MITTIEVGMLGFGTVGTGVVTRLTRVATRIERTQGLRLHLAVVAVSHLNAPRAVQLPIGTRLTDSIASVVEDPRIQIVVEVMGTVATAKRAIIAALKNGKSVVTANKDLMATAGSQLLALAQRHHCDLFYEASVAGGIPILRTLTDSYATDTVTGITGIINGTANYILSAMAEGQSYQRALGAAQRAGYAETDPSNDVTGLDAAYKLMILSRFAFGQPLTLSQVAPVGITDISAEQCQLAAHYGWQLKLLAEMKRDADSLYCRVAPVALPRSEALARIDGVQNAVAIQSEAIGASLYTGPGAGSTATANSVLSDVILAARHFHDGVRATVSGQRCAPLPVANFSELRQDYLAFGTSAIVKLQHYAKETNIPIQFSADNYCQLTALTAIQRQQIQAKCTTQLIPIMGTEALAATVAIPITACSNVAI